jgi:hypothetical protein
MNWMQSNIYSHSYLCMPLPANWKPYCSPAWVVCFSGHKSLNCGFKILLLWAHNIKHYLGVWLQKTFSAIKICRIANAVRHRVNVIVVVYLHYEFNVIVHSPVIKRVHASSSSSWSTKISSSVGHRVTSPCLLPSYLLALFPPLPVQSTSISCSMIRPL